MSIRLMPITPIAPMNQRLPQKRDDWNQNKQKEQTSFDSVLRNEIERQTQQQNVTLPENYQPFEAYAHVFHRLVETPMVDEKG